jgi:N-acetylmuramoyl-L-alanine amidase
LSAAERRALRARRETRDGAEPGRRGAAKPVPKMPNTRQDTRVRSPGITLAGTLLIVGLTVLAFAGGRLFGRVDEPTGGAQVEAMAPETPAAQSESLIEVPAPEAAAPVETPAPLPLAFARAPVVCLDPGHGGDDRGFQSFFTDGGPSMEEAVLVLEHAWDLEARLQQRGFDVVMTRETDAAVNIEGADVNGDGRTAAHDAPRSDRNKNLDELQARINVCNEADADLLVSMHINGFPDAAAQGYETWYSSARAFRDRNKLFAQLAFEELGQEMDAAGYNARPRGVNDDADAHVEVAGDAFDRYVITGPAQPGQIVPSAMPGAIVEVLFISNDADAAFLISAEGRNAIVTAYENAIVEYFERYPPEAS